jgi:hypothetical protein
MLGFGAGRRKLAYDNVPSPSDAWQPEMPVGAATLIAASD